MIDRELADFSRFEQIVDFVLIDEPFSNENGLTTLKQSLRRDAISSRYAKQIDDLYQSASQRPVTSRSSGG